MRKAITCLLVFLFVIQNLYANNNTVFVGSSFNYPPLSYIEHNHYTGNDVKIIRAFGFDNNLKIVFIKTSQDSLIKNMLNKSFSVAIGGITDTPEHRKNTLVSLPIARFYEVALIRCKDMNKYASFAQINTAKTRIVEWAYRTNQLFTKKYVTKAKIIVVKNNQLPFQYLLNKKADVILTESLEATYQHNLHPSLCSVDLKDEGFPIHNKIFLFSKTKRGYYLRNLFNHWWLLNKERYLANPDIIYN